ncbi:MAG TPA: FAD:protein FMN transferase [Acidimicrobiia bacterium]|jgi:thiamine biosynthesis lipoprotein
MGMAISMDFQDPVGQKVVDEIVRWFHEVDATYSTYKPESPISRYGLGRLSRSELTPEINDILELCETLRCESNGAFDPWSVPAPNGSRFDPSGIVKGWAVERAAEMLEAHGCANFCINAGGDIAVRGDRGRGIPWRIGVRHPYSPRRFAKVLELSGRVGIATSATYERPDHIIDPKSGHASAAIASATVIGPDLTLADAYATTVFVKGQDGLQWLQQRHPGYDGFIIYRDQTLETHGFREHVAAGHCGETAAK